MSSVSEVEELVDTFVAALGKAHRLLAAKASELMRHPEWSDVTITLDAAEMNADRADRYLAISGYVDGELNRVGGVVWYLEARRHGSHGWDVERSLRTIPNGDADIPAAELPIHFCDDSRALAQALPALTEELLRLPAPPQP